MSSPSTVSEPGRRAVDARQQVEQCRLARARRAHEREERARLDVEVERVERGDGVVTARVLSRQPIGIRSECHQAPPIECSPITRTRSPGVRRSGGSGRRRAGRPHCEARSRSRSSRRRVAVPAGPCDCSTRPPARRPRPTTSVRHRDRRRLPCGRGRSARRCAGASRMPAGRSGSSRGTSARASMSGLRSLVGSSMATFTSTVFFWMSAWCTRRVTRSGEDPVGKNLDRHLDLAGRP